MSDADSIQTANRAAGGSPSPWLYDDKLKMGGVKLFADGALGSRGACLKAPYADAPKQSGQDRKSVVEGKSVSVRVDLGGRRIIQKNHKHQTLRDNRITDGPQNRERHGGDRR